MKEIFSIRSGALLKNRLLLKIHRPGTICRGGVFYGYTVKACPRKEAAQYPAHAGIHNPARGDGSHYR